MHVKIGTVHSLVTKLVMLPLVVLSVVNIVAKWVKLQIFCCLNIGYLKVP